MISFRPGRKGQGLCLWPVWLLVSAIGVQANNYVTISPARPAGITTLTYVRSDGYSATFNCSQGGTSGQVLINAGQTVHLVADGVLVSGETSAAFGSGWSSYVGDWTYATLAVSWGGVTQYKGYVMPAWGLTNTNTFALTLHEIIYTNKMNTNNSYWLDPSISENWGAAMTNTYTVQPGTPINFGSSTNNVPTLGWYDWMYPGFEYGPPDQHVRPGTNQYDYPTVPAGYSYNPGVPSFTDPLPWQFGPGITNVNAGGLSAADAAYRGSAAVVGAVNQASSLQSVQNLHQTAYLSNINASLITLVAQNGSNSSVAGSGAWLTNLVEGGGTNAGSIAGYGITNGTNLAYGFGTAISNLVPGLIFGPKTAIVVTVPGLVQLGDGIGIPLTNVVFDLGAAENSEYNGWVSLMRGIVLVAMTFVCIWGCIKTVGAAVGLQSGGT